MGANFNNKNFKNDRKGGKFNKSAANDGDKKNNTPAHPRKEEFTLDLIADVTVPSRGATYTLDGNEITDILLKYYDNGTFDTFTQNVYISRALLDGNPDMRGTLTIGYITKITGERKMTVTIFGNFVEKIKGIIEQHGDKVAILPKVIINKDGKFKQFNCFDIVVNK